MKKIISFEKKLDFSSMIGEITAISLDHNLKFIDDSNIEGEFTISGSYKLTEASRIEENFNFTIPADIVLSEKLDLSTTKVEVDDFYYEIENDDTLICYIDIKVEGVEKIDLQEELREDVKEEIPTAEIIEEQKIEVMPRIEEQKTVENVKLEEKIEPLKEQTSITDVLPTVDKKEIEEQLSSSDERECDGDNTYQDMEQLKEMENKDMETKEKESENQTIEKEQSMGSLFSSLKESDETFATYSVYILRQEETIQSLIEKYKTTKEELESYNDLSNITIGSKIIIPVQND